MCLCRFDFEGVDVGLLFSEYNDTEKRLKELKEKGGIQRQVGDWGGGGAVWLADVFGQWCFVGEFRGMYDVIKGC